MHPTESHPRLRVSGRAALWTVAAILTLGAASGCAIIGLIADKTAGDMPVDAKYIPPREPMLVVVEDFANPDSVGLIADRIAHDVTSELDRNKVCPTIDPARLIEYRTAHPEQFHHLDIAALGRTLGARQVLYGHMDAYTIDSALGSGAAKGKAKVFVRIIDAKTGETRFPTDSGPGELVTAETPTIRLGNGDNAGTIEDGLVDRLAMRITWLFYKHQNVDDSNEMKN